MNRWLPALSVLALCAGLVLIAGVRPARPATVLPAVAAVTTTPAPAATPPTAVSGGPTATPTPPIPDGYRIRIPRLAIDLPIAEGDLERDAVRQETPDNFAFHFPGTALPGDRGNSYVYAHARRGMFLTLWNARLGDEVVIITPDARELRYVVSEVHARVDPRDLSWLAPTSSGRLTLQTSTGPDPADVRFVVVALPV
ncbi:MAG TPA: sortase [Candidatus Limnocylindria bacterium]|nr:sortase [Candidatus Limnocylindria bacterium]